MGVLAMDRRRRIIERARMVCIAERVLVRERRRGMVGPRGGIGHRACGDLVVQLPPSALCGAAPSCGSVREHGRRR